MLFFVEYSCSQSIERLIVDAEDKTQANEFAMTSAEELFDSYDHSDDIGTEDDYETIREYDSEYYYAMAQDIGWMVEEFDENNEIHKDTLKETGIYEI